MDQKSEELAKDVEIAQNVRRRRRRRNQRRRARNRQNRAARLASRNAIQQPHSNMVAGNRFRNNSRSATANLSALEKIRFNDVLTEEVQRFAEAVTNPFGNEAIGALLPDQFQELVIPAVDRHEFDLDYTGFNGKSSAPWYSFNSATSPYSNNSTAKCQLLGVILWFQPRCLESGVLASNSTTLDLPLYPYSVTSEYATDRRAILDQYLLCYTGYWYIDLGTADLNGATPFTGNVAGLFNTISDQSTPAREFPCPFGYRALPYPRIANIDANCATSRILGAGLKVWSEEAPIATGGYCVGGWAPMPDILDCVEWLTTGNNWALTAQQDNIVASLNASKSAASTLVQRLKGACREDGRTGVTVRYSPLQTPEQIEKEVVCVPSGFTNVNAVTITEPDGASTFDYSTPEPKSMNIDITKYDVCTRGTMLPCVFWKYNIAPTSTITDATTTDIYTLRVMSMVHNEGSPIGDSPFLSHKLGVEPGIDHIKMILENWDVFPPATGGHSFKSFAQKARHVLTKVTKGAGHVAKILALVDKYIGSAGTAAAM